MYYRVYDAKTSENAEDFMRKCLDFFPFKITHILTDNGLEFTNRLIKSKKGNACKKLLIWIKFEKKTILNIVLQNLIHLKQMVW